MARCPFDALGQPLRHGKLHGADQRKRLVPPFGFELKKKMIFKDDFHEIHNEPDQATEFEAIWQWLNSLPTLKAR